MMMFSQQQQRRLLVQTRRPALIGELFVAVGLLYVYDRLRLLTPVRRSVAIHRGFRILGLEGNFGFEARFNGWMATQHALSWFAVGYYQFLHIGAAAAVLMWCYRRRPEVYRLGRNALVTTNIIGLVAFGLYPVAPPRLLPNASFDDLVAIAGFGATHGPIPMNAYAAMPSLHLAWAVCVASTGIAASRRLWPKVAFAMHPVITAFVVIGTGNHYLVDVVTGAALGITVTAVSWWTVTRSPARQPTDTPVGMLRSVLGRS